MGEDKIASNHHHLPQSFIKNIAIEINSEYELNNSPFPPDCKQGIPFIGHNKEVLKFMKFLQNGSKKGVFLVTGYRGMGKTSFVNYVVSKYKNCEKPVPRQAEKEEETQDYGKIIDIHLTIAQNKPREIDILKLMTISVWDEFRKYTQEQEIKAKEQKSKISQKYDQKVVAIRNLQEEKQDIKKWLIMFLLTLIIPLIIIWKPELIKAFIENDHGIGNSREGMNFIKFIGYLLLSVFLPFLFILIDRYIKNRNAEKAEAVSNSANNRIKWLVERSHSIISEESGQDEEVGIKALNDLRLFAYGEKRAKQYPLASVKEIEYELESFLKLAKEKHKLEFIFIFDELDKVDPAVSTYYLYTEVDGPEKQSTDIDYQKTLRDRKQAVINIISGLKNFFTSAEARFIFIAGREMFDATMADISDRQSSLTSIFTYIFNIESFLKEKTELKSANKVSISEAIEELLKYVLFGKLETNPIDQNESLFTLLKVKLKIQNPDLEHPNEELGKIYFIIQNFITYLTYRCNGAPKVLIKAIHEFVHISKDGNEFNDERTIRAKNLSNTSETEMYLYFNYYGQYRIGFISYLYRPFLISFGRSLKQYSDNIILATPYLFDHLLKFHPFAFSITNLELIPEVLSTNKTPSLREHIKQIITYLGTNHIRETEVELFDYKFYSRTLNEINFLSMISEQESAAFNFTLDESYLVKLHIISKIKDLRNAYSKFSNNPDISTQQIFSIAHLNSMLGDLHFFDQEYEDAIIDYADAIRPINNIQVQGMNTRDFITLIKNKLKLGLCFEKTNSYEEALAFYSDSCQDAKRFMDYKLSHSEHMQVVNENSVLREPEDDKLVKSKNFSSSAWNDLLQIVIQCFLAKIFIQEKLGLEGITGAKLNIAMGGFIRMAESIKHRDVGRNDLIISNFYLCTGKLVYFKNSMDGLELGKDGKKILDDDTFIRLESLERHYKKILVSPAPKRKPVLAFYFYLMGLYEVIQSRNEDEKLVKDFDDMRSFEKAVLVNLFSLIDEEDGRFVSYHYKYIASFLSNIGDCMLSMLESKEKFRNYKISDIFDNEKVRDQENSSKNKFSDCLNQSDESGLGLSVILKCYYLSGRYFLKYGRSVSCSFQFRKILHLLRLLLSEKDAGNNSEETQISRSNLFEMIQQTLVEPVLEIASQNAGFADRHMLLKADESLTVTRNAEKTTEAKKEVKSMESFVFHNLSNHPETREVILLFNYIKIKLGETSSDIKQIISPYNSFATQYSRLLELDFFAKCLFMELKSVLVSKKLDDFKKEMTLMDREVIFTQMVYEYLFNMLSILRMLRIYGLDYMMGHSYQGYTHFKLANFLTQVRGIENEININLQIILEMDKFDLLGKGSHASLDESYHYLMAKDSYVKALQLHTAGAEYKKTMSDMIYLEDDFNDNAYHFGAAFDRYLMTNGVFAKMINECDLKIAELNVFSANSYIITKN